MERSWQLALITGRLWCSAQFVIGDGKDGYEKGKFYIKIDKDYKSEFENFAAVQSIANDRSTRGEG